MDAERAILKKLYIPKPCDADWDKMTKQEQGRYCLSCQRTVHDFTGPLTQEKVDLLKNPEKICGIFYDDEIDQQLRFIKKAVKPGLLSQARKTLSSAFLFVLLKMGTMTESSAQISSDTTKVMSSDEQQEGVDTLSRSRLSGRVVDHNGRILSNHYFSICHSNGEIIKDLRTDEEGRFLVYVNTQGKDLYFKSIKIKIENRRSRSKKIRYSSKTIYKPLFKKIDCGTDILIEIKSKVRHPIIIPVFRRRWIGCPSHFW